MGFFTTPDYDEFCILLEKATSEFIPGAQEDLALNLELTDFIKSKRIAPKEATKLLRSRLLNSNPNVQLLTLHLLDKCVKNGGKHFLVEFAGRDFVDAIVSLLDDEEYGMECNQVVQDKLAELFQEWALLFQSDPQLSYFTDTYSRLKREMRVLFPRPSPSLNQLDPTTIVSTCAPPDWIDSPVCLRCRDPFTFANRKHHCRKCGGCFCSRCSGRQMPILALGIVEEVRVCEPCFEQSGASASAKRVRVEEIAAPEPVKPVSTAATAVKDENEDLKRAIEASLQDQLKTALNGAPVQPAALAAQPVSVSVQPVSMPTLSHVPEPVVPVSVPVSVPPEQVHLQPPPVQPQQAPQIHIQQAPAPNVRDLIMPVEVETVGLFVQLISKLASSPSRLPQDQPAIAHLAAEMRSLQRRLQHFPQHFPQHSALNADLSVALNRLELLHSQAPPIHRPPSISALSSGSSELERMRGSMMSGLKSPNEPLRQQMRRLSIEAIEGPSRPESFGAMGVGVGVGVGVPVTPLGPIETTAPIVIPKKSEGEMGEKEKEKNNKDKEKKSKDKEKKKSKKKKSDKNSKKKKSDKKSDSKHKHKDKKHEQDPKNEKDPLIEEKPEKKKEKAKKSDKTKESSKKSDESVSPAEGIKAKESNAKSSKRRRSERIRNKPEPKKEVTNLIDL